MLWGGVGKEAGTSTVLLVWFNGTSRSPFCVRPCIQIRQKVLEMEKNHSDITYMSTYTNPDIHRHTHTHTGKCSDITA